MVSSESGSSKLAVVALLAMTAAWGSTFFMIADIVTRIPVPDLLAVRFAIAAVVMIIVAVPRIGNRPGLRLDRRIVRDGALLGLLYGGAQLLQTFGLAHTAASVSGFVTGLYVVATPLLGALILRTRIAPLTWVAVGLATVGLGILSLNGFSIGYGELLTLASAVVYAGHIIALSRISRPGSALGLTVVQLVVISGLCAVAATPGGIQLPATTGDWMIVVYLAVIAGTLTMLLQTWAQARIEPTRAAVIMAGEPIWAAAFAVALGGESVTWRMVTGGFAIVAAMYLTELAPRLRRRDPVEREVR
ncbi:DMT family transporter [Microlunatus speluncae]|uniref:DMT family transporter n=1 Tax=Microlunatus speluncae TaxID=2594267 RepID=UPI001266815E|nr:DMT family transporter [Microlunatus speluncae]